MIQISSLKLVFPDEEGVEEHTFTTVKCTFHVTIAISGILGWQGRAVPLTACSIKADRNLFFFFSIWF